MPQYQGTCSQSFTEQTLDLVLDLAWGGRGKRRTAVREKEGTI